MDWNTYRQYHRQQHGNVSRAKLSQDYQQYRQSQTRPLSPSRTISPARTISPPRTVRKLRSSPLKKQASPRVHHLMTLNDIEQMAKTKSFLIVVLYADWCGHCQAMKAKLGNKMRNYDKLIFVEEKAMDDKLKDHFPHILYYEDGKRQPDLTVNDVYNYLNL
ncbi:MAG TPA: protein disulfide isomerase family protein [Candidatus Saccharimonadales bacterium]|nr:protein disulfide isomerase family protein [Candidatus Saccharimonadales bacterium]